MVCSAGAGGGKEEMPQCVDNLPQPGPSYEKSLEWPRGVQNGLVRDQNFQLMLMLLPLSIFYSISSTD